MIRRLRGRPSNREVLRRAQALSRQMIWAAITKPIRRKHPRRPELTGKEREALGRILRQQDVCRRIRELKERGLTYRQIAHDPYIVRQLGHIVTRARICQILKQTPPSSERWSSDTHSALRQWCSHLQTNKDPQDYRFWNELVFPKLLARSLMNEPRWSSERVRLDDAEEAALPASGNSRDWRRDLRDSIIAHLFFKTSISRQLISESAGEVNDLAQKFKLSPRTICRILRRSLDQDS